MLEASTSADRDQLIRACLSLGREALRRTESWRIGTCFPAFEPLPVAQLSLPRPLPSAFSLLPGKHQGWLVPQPGQVCASCVACDEA